MNASYKQAVELFLLSGNAEQEIGGVVLTKFITDVRIVVQGEAEYMADEGDKAIKRLARKYKARWVWMDDSNENYDRALEWDLDDVDNITYAVGSFAVPTKCPLTQDMFS